MRKKVLQTLSTFMCIILFLVNLAATTVYAEGSTVSVQVEVDYGQTEAREMLSLINAFRTDESEAWEWKQDDSEKIIHTDLQELQYDYALEKIAMQRAAEIALSYSHTRPDGSSCWGAYGDYNAQGSAENIAAGYDSAKAVFTAWQETNEQYAGQGHRRNMLNGNFNAVGIGHAYYNGTHYWVQEFAKTSTVDSSTTSAANNSVTATINVSTSYISNTSLSCKESEIRLKTGETAELPEVSLTANIKEHWPASQKCSNLIIGDGVQWSSSDETIVKITGNTIQAVARGSTTLKAQLADAASEVNITVESGEPEEPSTPEEPSEPEEPSTPEEPSELEEPSTPEKPSEPEKPAEEPSPSTDSSSDSSSSSDTPATAAAPKVVQPSYTTKDNRKVSGWQEVIDTAYAEAQSDRALSEDALSGKSDIAINITSVTELSIPRETVASMKQKNADYTFHYQNIAITISHETLSAWTEGLDLKIDLDTKKDFGAGFDALHIGKHTNRAIPEESIINVMLAPAKAGNYAYIFGRSNQQVFQLLSTAQISEFGTIAVSAGMYDDYMILY